MVSHNGHTATVLDRNFCRLCLGRDGTELISVFAEHVNTENREPLSVRIQRFFEVQITETDVLPTRICQQCLLQTECCSEFRELCIRNDEKLRELLSFQEPEEVQNFKQEDFIIEEVEEAEEDVNEDISDDEQEEEEEEEIPEMIIVDPTKDYESSNQSMQELFSDEDQNEDSLGMDDPNDESIKMANMNESSEDLLDESKLKKLVHMCRYCDVAFAMSNACYVHETQDHDLLAPYACQFCEFKTVNRSILITHIRDIHGIDRPYICIQCNKGFHRRSDLKKHTFVHSGVRPFACHECGKSFSRNTNLTKHLRIHSGFKPHICNTCPRSFANKADLVRHQNIHMSLGKQFSCSKCNNTYARKDKLLSHERICFAKQQQQQQQLLQQEQITQIMAAIPITQAEFDAENMVIALDPYQEIDQTQTEEDPGIPNAAPISAISAFSNISLAFSQPQPNASPTFQSKLFSCQKCPKKFLSKNTLHTHQLTHSDVRNYRCHTCDKKFIRKRELDRHLTAVHSNHKPFECKQCSKRFSRKDKLLRHERVHRDDKFFACISCDAKFLRKEALSIHSKIHCTAAIRDDPSEVIIMIDQAHQDQLLEQVLSYAAEDVGISAAMM